MKRLTLFLALALTVCSTAMAETLTTESAVGTIGTLNGREAMVVDLGGSIGKVAVATRNVGAEKASETMFRTAFGTKFNLGKANDPNENGLTDGWYIPSKAELEALQKNLTPNKGLHCVEWEVTDNATLYLPGLYLPGSTTGSSIYRGRYASSDREQEGGTWKCWTYEFLFYENGTSFGGNDFEESDEQETEDCAIRPFHKLLSKNQYLFYTSSDGNVVTPNSADFNVSIESNDYKDGQGVIIFDGELTSIGKDAFSGKSTLTSVTLPASVTSIGDYAFKGTAISKLDIPASVTRIKEGAFYQCASLASLTFADNSKLEMIAEHAFFRTAISGRLDLPSSLKSIGGYAFMYTQITAVTIPALVTTIGFRAFEDCDKLGTLAFAEGSQLGTIKQEAFNGTQITAVTIPAMVTTIENFAFGNCSQLSSLTFAEGSQLDSIGDGAFNYTAISGDLTIPASVTNIQWAAFENCQLSKVYMILGNLSKIASNAFYSGAVIVVPINLYETYKSHFDGHNKVEVTPLKDWQEYTIAKIEAAMKTANTLSPTDKSTIEGYFADIRDAESFDEVCTIRDVALALIDKQKAFEESVKGVLGDLGTGRVGPAIKVTGKNGKSIMLFELDKVEFVNIDIIGQGEAEATGIGNVRWIQLWEGGPKFAEYNIGATSVTDDGGYYTWGGMYKNGKDITWDGTYNEGSSVLSGETDTATNLWGSNWRMPTSEELKELINSNNCDKEWTTVDGVNGCKFTGKGDYKYNSIFLPAAGTFDSGRSSHFDEYAFHYWSSTPNNDFALKLISAAKTLHINISNRNVGSSVRAVLNEE